MIIGDEMIIGDMVGRTFVRAENKEDVLLFTDSYGKYVKFYHEQDCCEDVHIEDIVGDLHDLVGSPILVAEEVSSRDFPPPKDCRHDSYTWTFYRFSTIKGTVTVRWLGTSNGYYSERVSIVKGSKQHSYE